MTGLIMGPVSGTVKIIRNKSDVDAKTGYELKHGECLQLGDNIDSSCWLMHGRLMVASITKPKNGKKKLVVNSYHPPCRSVTKLEDEFVITAFPHGKKKFRGARVLRAAY